jgi:hypothetical protein
VRKALHSGIIVAVGADQRALLLAVPVANCIALDLHAGHQAFLAVVMCSMSLAATTTLAFLIALACAATISAA